jgi:hypothetical protein
MVRDIRDGQRTVAVGHDEELGRRSREELENWLGGVVKLDSDQVI